MDGFHLEVTYGTPHVELSYQTNAMQVLGSILEMKRCQWKINAIAKMLDSLDWTSEGSMMLQNFVRRERQRGMGRGGGGEVWRTAGGGSKGAGEVASKRVSAFQVLNSDLRISLNVFRSQSVSLSHSLCIKVQCCISSDL